MWSFPLPDVWAVSIQRILLHVPWKGIESSSLHQCQASLPFPRFLGTLTPTSAYYGIRPRNLLHDSRLIIVHHTRIKEKLLNLSSDFTISFCTEDSRYFAGARRSLQAFQPSGYLAQNQLCRKVHRYGQFALYQKFVRQSEMRVKPELHGVLGRFRLGQDWFCCRKSIGMTCLSCFASCLPSEIMQKCAEIWICLWSYDACQSLPCLTNWQRPTNWKFTSWGLSKSRLCIRASARCLNVCIAFV